MGTIEVTANCLYSIKFEDAEEKNWLEAEMVNHTKEARIPVGDVY